MGPGESELEIVSSMLKDIEMTDPSINDEKDDKGKEKFSMLTSHDDGYTEPIYNTSDLEESILDDEEEWHAESDEEVDSIVEDEEEDEGAEMVIERPFNEPQAALLDLAHAETPVEASGTGIALDPISLKNILPPGVRRNRPTSFD